MKKILIVFGTRPEAIKMAPIAKKLESEKKFKTKICVTAQHRQMLDQVLDIFDIKPDYDLNLMKENQSLYDITCGVLNSIKDVYDYFAPDIVLVHGDTTTTFAASLAAFYKKIKIGHVEAGLRTGNLYAPWPEEANRALTGILTNYHFAPTETARQNLLKEGKEDKNIIVTGNTVIDALYYIVNKINSQKELEKKIIDDLFNKYNLNLTTDKKIILVTGHRRENFGDGFINICEALKELAERYSDSCEIIYPAHLNPNVQKPVNNILRNIKNVHIIEPLRYEIFVYLMSKSYLVITDSGGIQEEAPGLGKPVLVMREVTERPEAVLAGTVKLVGTDKVKIFNETKKLIENSLEYEKMSKAINPYGEGKASDRIIDFLKKRL